MAVKFATKTAPAPAPAAAVALVPPVVDQLKVPATQALEHKQQVDEIVALDLQLKPWIPTIKRYEKVKASLQSVAKLPQFDPTLPVVLIGDTGSVEFSPASDAKEIKDMNGLIGVLKAKIGYPALLEILKISTEDVAKYLSEAEYAPFYGPKIGVRKLVTITSNNGK